VLLRLHIHRRNIAAISELREGKQMNGIQIIGRLGSDPELKDVGDNQVAEFSLADDQYEGRDKDKTTGWYRCQVWGNRAHTVMDYLHKGAPCTVFGRLKQRKYTTKDGDERISLDVNVTDFSLPPRAQDDEEPQQSRGNDRGRSNERSAPAPRSRARDEEQEERQPARTATRTQPRQARYQEEELDDVPF
jgi:single-strand DNA-binding protein